MAATVMNLGGVFLKRGEGKYEFAFPYVYDLELIDPDDYFNVLVVVNDNVPVKEKPGTDEKTVVWLSYDIVRFDYNENEKLPIKKKGWMYVRTMSKKPLGYVEESNLYSPVDMRMILGRIKGVWKITAFVGGD
ncbi:MAG: hypothetical protein HYV28_02330 [Ignavibacteriales bacterium]|nr:hypothetical protein [Ignavibacteriales bacterium]